MRQRKSYLKQKLSLQNDQDTNLSIFPAAGEGPLMGGSSWGTHKAGVSAEAAGGGQKELNCSVQ